MKFVEETLKLVKRTPLTHREVAEGAGVNYWWYIKFASEALPNPTTGPTQKVYDFLTRRETIVMEIEKDFQNRLQQEISDRLKETA